jgi:hypothetical protein
MDTEGLEGIRPIQIDLWANDRKTDYTEVDSEPPIKSPFRQVRSVSGRSFSKPRFSGAQEHYTVSERSIQHECPLRDRDLEGRSPLTGQLAWDLQSAASLSRVFASLVFPQTPIIESGVTPPVVGRRSWRQVYLKFVETRSR